MMDRSERVKVVAPFPFMSTGAKNCQMSNPAASCGMGLNGAGVLGDVDCYFLPLVVKIYSFLCHDG